MAKISIIVPCYNAEKSVERTLESLLNQTCKDICILAIDDGSKDTTGKILDDYQAKYPEIIKVFHKPNEGIAATRNFGLDHVETPYFGFLDSDDYCEPEMFEKLLAKAESSGAEVVVSNFTWETSKGPRLEKEGPYSLHKEMLIKLFAVLWNKLYLTEAIKATGLRFPDGNRYEDACFLYSLVPHLTKIDFIDESFVHYVQVETSITHTNNNEVKNMIVVFKKIVEHYKEMGWFEEYHDELEYLHIKFFLGNSFLRSSMIQDKQDRTTTINMGWELLNKEFPNWSKNPYLKSLGGMKNKYFSLVRSWNIYLFAWVFRHFKKIKA